MFLRFWLNYCCLLCTRAVRGCHSIPGARTLPGGWSLQGSVCGQRQPSSGAVPGLPGSGGAGRPGVVPRHHEPPRSGETAARRRRLPGPKEHHQPGVLRTDGHAQRTSQTPAAGGPRRHGKMEREMGESVILHKHKHTELLSLLKGTDKRSCVWQHSPPYWPSPWQQSSNSVCRKWTVSPAACREETVMPAMPDGREQAPDSLFYQPETWRWNVKRRFSGEAQDLLKIKRKKNSRTVILLWRLKMLYFWEDLGAFGRDILIWCFKRFKNDRCSSSLDDVQIKPQRGVNERYFRIIKKNNKILVLSVKHNHISRGRVVTEAEWWKAELFLRNLCTWGKMSNILPPQGDPVSPHTQSVMDY